LRIRVAVIPFTANDKIHQRVVGISSIHRQGRNAGTRDHRERKKTISYDVTQRSEAANPLTYALEPAVRANRIQGKFSELRHG
jgi:hypothetical protein